MRATLLRQGYGVPSKLSEADTRCYGSLTTFNILVNIHCHGIKLRSEAEGSACILLAETE
jgi:hypothetical protein